MALSNSSSERASSSAMAIEPSPDRKAQVARHKRGRKGRAMVPGIVADAAADLEAVAKASRDNETGRGPAALEDNVGGDCRAMDEVRAAAEQLAH